MDATRRYLVLGQVKRYGPDRRGEGARSGFRHFFRLVCLAWTTLLSWTATAQPMTIPDYGLESAIRETLGLAGEDLTPELMLGLRSLDASRREVTTLEGLGAARNLAFLDLGFNQFPSTLAIPAGLTNLQTLKLRGNQLTRLEAPGDLDRLIILDLTENLIGDFSFLTQLPALATLELEANDLSTLPLPLGVTNLAKLNLASNRLADLSFLDRLSQLETLFLDDNNLRNLAAPPALDNLTVLSLGINRLTNFAFLSSLPNLWYLDLSANRPPSLELPTGLTNLLWINLSENRLAQLTLPRGMSNLGTLHLYDNLLTDTGFLGELSRLTFLDLGLNRLSEVTLPPALTNLTWLDVRWNPLRSLILPETLVGGMLAETIAALRGQGVVIYPYPIRARLELAQWRPSPAFTFTLQGPPQVYAVQRSPDLLDWTALDLLTNRVGTVEFTDAEPAGRERGFYRLRPP